MDRLALLHHAIQQAGEVLLGFFKHPLVIKKKGQIDLVTSADLASEAMLTGLIRRYFPSDSIFAEESGTNDGTSDYRWIIDPLDGTTNFSHGLGHFAISIGLEHAGTIMAGAILDPVKKEFFHVEKGKGAFLWSQTLTVSKTKQPNMALSVSGFPYDRRSHLPELLTRVERALANFQGFRRYGAAALDLAYLAAGRFDLFWETGLKPWDLAAGTLLVTEAGGCVSMLDGSSFNLEKGEILAANPSLHPLAIKILQP